MPDKTDRRERPLTEHGQFGKPGAPLRAPRVTLQVPVRYHVIGDREYEGWTENISRAGALIRSPSSIPLGAELDIILTLPTGTLSGLAGEIICTGTVVRLIPAVEGELPGFGVMFRKCRPTVGNPSF